VTCAYAASHLHSGSASGLRKRCRSSEHKEAPTQPEARHQYEVCASIAIQRVWRARGGVRRIFLTKAESATPLGLKFSPDWRVHSILEAVHPFGQAHGHLKEGDLIRSINGTAFFEPADSARRLRESCGRIELIIVPRAHIDMDRVHADEIAAVDRCIAASTGGDAPLGDSSSTEVPPDDECAICFQLLCEPVRWPGAVGGCSHYICKPCVKRLAGHSGLRPCCPLCRAPTKEPLTPGKIVVDEVAASRIEGRHPKAYAECLVAHRQLSLQELLLSLNHRQRGQSPPAEAAQPAVNDTSSLPPAVSSAPPPTELPVCIGYNAVHAQLRVWQQRRQPPRGELRATFRFTQTEHLHAIAHALASASHRFFVLPSHECGAGATGLVVTVMTARMRHLFEFNRPLATLDNLIRGRQSLTHCTHSPIPMHLVH